jgi:tRNA A37 threonylcarbamoyladenosine modification protein TsaB
LIALMQDGAVIGERRWQSEPGAGRQVLAEVQELLVEGGLELADVGRIAVSAGPAKRTSALRAGVTVANLLAYGSGAALVQVAGESVADIIREAQEAALVDMVVPKYAAV